MTKTFKLISAAVLVAATSTAALAQEVPLNTVVAGGEGAEKLEGQAAGALGAGLTAAGTVIGLTVLTVLGSADGSSSTTTN
ncbi:MAG: hypothetical protein ABJF86_01950 [Tateyamaria sp.]|uniref:hypothetical protein n=1 Tax=Tateyamaria sp. TaxID=1929288 RepID=UPI00328B1603